MSVWTQGKKLLVYILHLPLDISDQIFLRSQTQHCLNSTNWLKSDSFFLLHSFPSLVPIHWHLETCPLLSSKWLQKIGIGEIGSPYTPFADLCIKPRDFTIYIPELIIEDKKVLWMRLKSTVFTEAKICSGSFQPMVCWFVWFVFCHPILQIAV